MDLAREGTCFELKAEELVELYSLNDDLEQYTRKKSVEMSRISESAYNSTEEAVLKVALKAIEFSHHVDRKGLEELKIKTIYRYCTRETS